MKLPLTGGCQCGALRYRLDAQPTGASLCFCRMCQKAFGNYFAPLAGVKRKELVWTRGTLGVFRSSVAVERGFCRDCGTPLTYAVIDADRISVSLGSLDDPAAVPPTTAWGVEGKRAPLAVFDALPAHPDDAMTSEQVARFASRQHPDRET